MSQRSQPHFAICLEELVTSDHPYHKLDALIDFEDLSWPLKSLYSCQPFGACRKTI